MGKLVPYVDEEAGAGYVVDPLSAPRKLTPEDAKRAAREAKQFEPAPDMERIGWKGQQAYIKGETPGAKVAIEPQRPVGRSLVPYVDEPQMPVAATAVAATPVAPSKTRTWGDVPLEAISNIPKSAGNFVSGIYQAVRHPLDTGLGLLDTAAGGLRNALPDSVVNFVEGGKPSAADMRVRDTANAVGRFYADRYGSGEGFKQAIATDPVGILSDASMAFTGGAGLAAKAPVINKALTTATNVTNPINIVGTAVGKAAPVIGKVAANLSSTLGTHTGALPLQQAAKSGYEGGKSAKDFVGNLRGNVPMTDVLDAAKANLEVMGRAKSAEYRAGMAQVSGDKSVLSFDGIDLALDDAAKTATFKGQVKNQRADEVLQKIKSEIASWKKLNPSEYHTPEGLDALKQKVGGIVEGIPFEEKTARLVGNRIYGSIKSEITKQAPVYDDVMKGYSEASDQIREIERALSLNSKASIDTAMRKLQSLTRNNVNTNYGNRADLARQLEEQGGNALMPALAGQALNTWQPRGLGGGLAGGLTVGAGAYGGFTGAGIALAGQSPRLAGEAAYKLGQSARWIKKPIDLVNRHSGGLNPSELANLFSQAGLLNQR